MSSNPIARVNIYLVNVHKLKYSIIGTKECTDLMRSEDVQNFILLDVKGIMVYINSFGKVSDCESFQLALLIICVPAKPGAECAANESLGWHLTRRPFNPRESR